MIVVVAPPVDTQEWTMLVNVVVRTAADTGYRVVCCGDRGRAEQFAEALERRLPSIQTILERQSQSEAEGVVFATSFLPVDVPVIVVSAWWQLRLRAYTRHWRQTGRQRIQWVRCGGLRGWLHVTSELLLLSGVGTNILAAQRREELLTVTDEQVI